MLSEIGKRAPTRGAQLAHVEVGGRVVAFVLGLGVDHEAVGTATFGDGRDLRLADRVVAVDVLPAADLEPGPVEDGRPSGALNWLQMSVPSPDLM